MDTSLLITVATILLGIISFFLRAQMQRIDTLEDQIATKTSEAEVRQLLADKVDPLKEKMSEITEKVDKVIDLLIKKR
jgi:Tfp pilus assembly protein PilO